MKVKYFPIVFISLLFITGCRKIDSNNYGLNLDFEDVENGMPKGWNINVQPEYSVFLDSINSKSGKYALAVEFTGDTACVQYPSSQSFLCILPENFDGEKITLSGYMKTENINPHCSNLISKC